jgi:uncharacterized phage protein (TIGR01671 family)|nr:MAG TPA: YopX protein [Caudoviricetes sp.]
MQDRYLFRGKRIDNGEWVHGYLFDDGFENGRVFIGGIVIEKYNGTACDDWNVTGINFYEIDPNTICQCTGLKDKNGRVIWENDIASYSDLITRDKKTICIEWNKMQASFVRKYRSPMGLQYLYLDEYIASRMEVIGNTFDSPELLEG